MKKGISVIICTYNGKQLLPETLRHLSKQKFNIPYEIILVDNASTDGTKVFVDNWWSDNGNTAIEYNSYSQPIPGKSYAQEMGYAKAKYEYLLVCDDDNWLCDSYIQTAFDIMETDASIGALGGWCEAEFEAEKPVWFDKYSRFFAVSRQGDISGDITNKKGCLFGAGMIVRKSHWETLEQLGFEQQLSCRKGNSLSSGGDTEHSYALRLLGYKIWFDERLYFKHYMTSKRMTLNYVSRLRKAMVHSNFLLLPYHGFFNNNIETKKSLKHSAITQLKKQWKRKLYDLILGDFDKKEDAKTFFRMIKLKYFDGDLYENSKLSILKWKP